MEIVTSDLPVENLLLPSASSRHLTGLLQGAITGLVFGAVSGYANHILLWGVPYFQAPFGSFGNLLVITVIGALAGLATGASPRRSIGILSGVITAAALGGLHVIAQAWFFSSQAAGDLTGFGLIFLVLCLVFTPLVLLLRLGIDAQAKYADQAWVAWDRIRWPLVLGMVALVAGFFGVYSAQEFNALTKTAELIRQGQAAGQPSSLPADLSAERVPSFWEHRNESFRLLLVPGDLASGAGEIVVVAGFESGWNLLCKFGEDQSLRNCEELQPASIR